VNDGLLAAKIHAATHKNENSQNAARALLEQARDILRTGEPLPPKLAAYLAECLDGALIAKNPNGVARALNISKPASAPTKYRRDRQFAFEYWLLRAQGVVAVAAQRQIAERYGLPVDKDEGAGYVKRIARTHSAVKIIANDCAEYLAELEGGKK
jgi:hypothetical protein